ncbi:K(+)/H(+) antiporter [Stygiomarasmius scandens]|uniref:K(+)/H(+) antiporter n=1 Tax=Marasmiellus scandens TaxID=2682957 RepID=A0ABR1K1B5_9AGAR
MGEFTQLYRRAAASQAGIFSGANPADYDSNDPIRLWVIQVIVIMAMTQVLALIFGRIRQPRVIAEVIGGVFLGPTVMGRIHGFRNAIFPDDGMPLLNLTANIGLVLFLFIVGLEIDTRLIKKNVKASASISIAGLVVPLGLGAALGEGIYREFVNPDVNHGYFLLFTAVAVGITAFPVLCRILTELKLLDTTVGVVTLSAGVGNDVIGWILLALTVALVNASSGLTALWVLLTAVGYCLLLLLPGKWAYHWLAKKTGSLESGTPTAFMMTITIVVVFFSAFFTDIIGVHAIFGGFLAGLIIPHQNGYAIAMVEKLEDLVTIVLLPLYFASSGLRTNLGLLDNGITWGYTIIIILVAFTSKFLACASTAKLAGFNLRESGAIGSLMSCKGLVELIVLNVGLQAGILDTRVFSMFVIHAIILTFMTTPLVLLFYPAKYRVHLNSSATLPSPEDGKQSAPQDDNEGEYCNVKYALVLDKIEQLSAAMTVTQLLCPSTSVSPSTSTLAASERSSIDDEKAPAGGVVPPLPSYQNVVKSNPLVSPISLTLLRLIELTTRTSDVLKSQEASALIHSDPVTSVFRTFAWLLGGAAQRLRVKVGVDVASWEDFDAVISRRVTEENAGMVVIPWSRGNSTTGPSSTHDETAASTLVKNPFDGVFQRSNSSTSSYDQTTTSVVYSELIRKVFLTAPCDVALFVDRGLDSGAGDVASMLSGTTGPDTLLVLPFFGGPDDRLALKFLVKMCAGNEGVRAIVVRISKTEESEENVDEAECSKGHAIVHNTIAAADTVYGQHNTQTRLASDTADNILWERYTSSSTTRTPVLTSALSRITFNSVNTSKPLQASVDSIIGSDIKSISSGRRTVAVIGRSRRMAVESLDKELQHMSKNAGVAMGSSVAKTLGNVGAAMVLAGVDASLLIVQAHYGATA